MDVAGVADTEKELPYYGKGATGWGVAHACPLGRGTAQPEAGLRTTNMTCLACDRIEQIKQGQNPRFIAELSQSYVVLGDEQFYRGWCVLLSNSIMSSWRSLRWISNASCGMTWRRSRARSAMS